MSQERSGRIRPLTPLGLGWPNILSVFRILLVPVLVALLLARRDPTDIAAAAVFAVGATTDLLDGYLARRWGISTRTGQWLDPLADKLLVAAPVVTLTVIHRFPLLAAIVILAREVLVTGLRVYLGSRGRGMPASWVAKLKTAFQLLAILLYILPLPDGFRAAKLTVLVVAVALTVLTGADYSLRARGLARAAEPSRAEEHGGREG